MRALEWKEPVALVARTGSKKSGYRASKSSANNGTNRPTRQARWKAENPKAAWAHSCLASAIRRGLVEREPCEVCGAEPTDGHHDNYDQPMTVRWLCRRHHRAVHKRMNGGGNV